MHEPDSFGERIADVVAGNMGSWRFIIIQTLVVILWMTLNLLAVLGRWDPYPFILLNLLFSTQAAYAAPIIMMSQNRQATKDRKRDDQEAIEVHLLYSINQQQLDILQHQQQEIVLLRSLLHANTIKAAEEHAPDEQAPTAASVDA